MSARKHEKLTGVRPLDTRDRATAVAFYGSERYLKALKAIAIRREQRGERGVTVGKVVRKALDTALADELAAVDPVFFATGGDCNDHK